MLCEVEMKINQFRKGLLVSLNHTMLFRDIPPKTLILIAFKHCLIRKA